MLPMHVHLSMAHGHVVLVLEVLLQHLQVQLDVLHVLDDVGQQMQLLLDSISLFPVS